MSRLFASVTGTSLLAESLKQMAQIRFTLTRDAILLQMVMLEVGYLDRMPNSVSKMVHSTFIPRYSHSHVSMCTSSFDETPFKYLQVCCNGALLLRPGLVDRDVQLIAPCQLFGAGSPPDGGAQDHREHRRRGSPRGDGGWWGWGTGKRQRPLHGPAGPELGQTTHSFRVVPARPWLKVYSLISLYLLHLSQNNLSWR